MNHRMLRQFAWLLALTFINCFNPAMAAETPVDANTIGMVTGPKTGTYIRIGHDIANIAKEYGVTIDVKESRGSIENIQRINSQENAALGIVQSDLLGFLKRSKNPKSQKLAEDLRMVFPFYNEEVHLLAHKAIKNVQDLSGKRVVVGEEGSGHWLTAMNILSLMDVKPSQYMRLSPPEAVVAILQGEADAMFFVGGKPVKLFKNLEDLKNMQDPAYAGLLSTVHFLSLNSPKLKAEYEPSVITKEDYSFVDMPVQTISVTAMLMSYDFSKSKTSAGGYKSSRCEEIGRVAQAIRTRLPELQETGHAKWNEVALNNSNVGIWQQDSCVQQFYAEPTPANPLEADLLNAIQRN